MKLDKIRSLPVLILHLLKTNPDEAFTVADIKNKTDSQSSSGVAYWLNKLKIPYAIIGNMKYYTHNQANVKILNERFKI